MMLSPLLRTTPYYDRLSSLDLVRHDEMTKAEVNHLIGFALVTLAAIVMGITEGPVFGMAMMVGNVLLNLYPSLLQQENKRRIDRVIRRRESA